MNWMIKKVKGFFCEEDGVTAIEYGLIAALIAVAIIITVELVGDRLVLIFQAVADALLLT